MSLPNVTLRQVAQAAGVSLGTASQALRNIGRTSTATRSHVQKIAKSLGYRPDPVMASIASRHRRGLSSQRETPVVFLTRMPRELHSTNFRFKDPVKTRLDELGYAYRPFNLEAPSDLRLHIRQWYHQGVRGVIVAHFSETELLTQQNWSPFSMVMLGMLLRAPLMHTVKSDAALAFEELLGHLLKQPGKIGLAIHQHSADVHDDHLREGVAQWMIRRHPDRFCPILWLNFDESFEAGSQRLGVWFRKHRPRIISGFAVARSQLSLAGVSSGEDCTFFSFGTDDPADDLDTSHEPNEEIATRGIELLDSMIRHGERGLPARPMTLSIPLIQKNDRISEAV